MVTKTMIVTAMLTRIFRKSLNLLNSHPDTLPRAELEGGEVGHIENYYLSIGKSEARGQLAVCLLAFLTLINGLTFRLIFVTVLVLSGVAPFDVILALIQKTTIIN